MIGTKREPLTPEERERFLWYAKNTRLSVREICKRVSLDSGVKVRSPSAPYEDKVVGKEFRRLIRERKKRKTAREVVSPKAKEIYEKLEVLRAERELEEELSKVGRTRLTSVELLKMKLDFKGEIEEWLFYCDRRAVMFHVGDKSDISGVLGYGEPEKIRILLTNALKMLDKSKNEEEMRKITDYAITQAINNITNNPPHVRLEKCHEENVNVLVDDKGRVLCPRRWKDEDGSWNCTTLELEEDLDLYCPFRRYKFIQEIEVPY